MIYIIILAIVFLVMLTAPFGIAYIYAKNRKSDILLIRQEKVKDARYFGKSFAKMVEENLETTEKGTICLSHQERFVDGDKRVISTQEVDQIIICRDEDFIAEKEVKAFHKEIYSANNVAMLGNETVLRAAYAKKMMVLGKGTIVERWVDAEETLAIYDDCRLGMSASAGRRLSIGKGCTFHRLFAPEILVGQYPESIKLMQSKTIPRLLESEKELEVVRNIKTIDNKLANDDHVANITVLSVEDVVVLERLIVKGDITSEKSVRVCDNAIVCGNIFAEEDIRIGSDAIVFGNVFTQGSIYLESGAMIGRPGSIVSVIAREDIVMEKKVTIHGYVSCEKNGSVVSAATEREDEQYSYLSLAAIRTHLYLEDASSYEKVKETGFRNDEFLQKVEINLALKEIPRSLFYGCKSLKSVSLPISIERIGQHAFAECVELAEMTSLSELKLGTIETSAFENCHKLPGITLPEQLTCIGNAAFSGCSELKYVLFAPGCELKEIGSHCFKDCTSLTELILPARVERIGMSAFAGCDALKKITIPERCMNQPGIEELTKCDVQISYLEEY